MHRSYARCFRLLLLGASSPLADTSRFAGLIDVYTTLATSDSVIRVLERRGLVNEQDMQDGAKPITAAAVVSTVGGGTTPMMTITGRVFRAQRQLR